VPSTNAVLNILVPEVVPCVFQATDLPLNFHVAIRASTVDTAFGALRRDVRSAHATASGSNLTLGALF
jgi:hypothetical protein